ncbi:MAG: excisionase family DNA-binding protein [Massilia sp.]|uniref:GAF domain-containing protein n=1 Tax=Massilia sp. TaxID=1882437 RepID=UPI0019C7E837|nr:helix-turn-helix domain-containing protein [Oxalobacteraceae sp. CFBP 8761]MBD8625377.1 helix-turn-helix domain-containing protein [Oxalobacteraceae sp. CFBP 8753]
MKTHEFNDPILTTREAAQLLGVAVSTAQVWMESGDLPAWKTPGGHRRVRYSAVMRLVRERVASKDEVKAVGQPGGAELATEFLPAAAPDYPVPANEAQRLAALAQSGLMNSEDDAAFDRLTWLAGHATACPMALITLLSAERQWCKSRVGVENRETTRSLAFCSHALMQDEPFVVEDASADPRFADNPMVTGAPFIRFYAGYPVRTADGLALGSLCVLDTEPRRLREREMRALRELAVLASDEVQRRA